MVMMLVVIAAVRSRDVFILGGFGNCAFSEASWYFRL
jgi:hypothetical protein